MSNPTDSTQVSTSTAIAVKRNPASIIFSVKETGILLGLIGLIIVFSLISPVFLTINNMMNIVRQISLLGIMAVGMTMVIVSGEFDLSVGSVYGMAGDNPGAAHDKRGAHLDRRDNCNHFRRRGRADKRHNNDVWKSPLSYCHFGHVEYSKGFCACSFGGIKYRYFKKDGFRSFTGRVYIFWSRKNTRAHTSHDHCFRSHRVSWNTLFS